MKSARYVWTVWLGLFLVACVSTSVPDASPATLPAVIESATELPPVPASATLESEVVNDRRFDRYLPFGRQQEVNNHLTGLRRQDGTWQLIEMVYPPGFDSIDSDYSPAADRLLAWRYSAGAGPGNLSAGQLVSIDLATREFTEIFPADVVSASWAPNGEDFAYILATPDTYELRWKETNGDDRLLAVDVPHSLRVSPDGRFVAFTRESHYGLAGDPGLFVVNIETGEETMISSLDRAGYGGSGPFWKPQWSADSGQVVLYATADSDRAATPHEAGFAIATVDGSLSQFVPESAFLSEFNEPMDDPELVPCIGATNLLLADQLIMSIGGCIPMSGGGPVTFQPIRYSLDMITGAVHFVQSLSGSTSTVLLDWDDPGESILLWENDEVVSRTLSPEMPAQPAAPQPEIDSFALARKLIEGVAPIATENWQVEPCEGEGAFLCIGDGQETVGVAELMLFHLDNYDSDHVIHEALSKLPPDASDYDENDSSLAREALAALSEEQVAVIIDDRAMTYAGDIVMALPPESLEMGALPALAFGFERTNTAGVVQESYTNIVAFDQQFMYWFTINYDPANVSTFVSEPVLKKFTPIFFEIASGLRLPKEQA